MAVTANPVAPTTPLRYLTILWYLFTPSPMRNRPVGKSLLRRYDASTTIDVKMAITPTPMMIHNRSDTPEVIDAMVLIDLIIDGPITNTKTPNAITEA